jgi:hypothetical protein
LQMPGLKETDQLTVDSIQYDETAHNNTLQQRLNTGQISVTNGSLTLRIPPFTHYQTLRIRTPNP